MIPIDEIDKIDLQVPVKVRLWDKAGKATLVPADEFLTTLLKTLQGLQASATEKHE
jgi:hypothetical protein